MTTTHETIKTYDECCSGRVEQVRRRRTHGRHLARVQWSRRCYRPGASERRTATSSVRDSDGRRSGVRKTLHDVRHATPYWRNAACSLLRHRRLAAAGARARAWSVHLETSGQQSQQQQQQRWRRCVINYGSTGSLETSRPGYSHARTHARTRHRSIVHRWRHCCCCWCCAARLIMRCQCRKYILHPWDFNPFGRRRTPFGLEAGAQCPQHAAVAMRSWRRFCFVSQLLRTPTVTL